MGTSGSEGGQQKPTSRKAGRAQLPAPYTYVPTWSGMAFTAFVSDVFSRRIVGWRTSYSMPTQLPLDALEMALWTRGRAGHTDPDGCLDGLIHHSDQRRPAQLEWLRSTLRLMALEVESVCCLQPRRLTRSSSASNVASRDGPRTDGS
jgi:transposase InsO family protein